MLSISPAFVQYLNETAPSLFYQVPLGCLSFRWKIPEQELLIGWTSKKSGIDMVADLNSGEICGFTGIHFPGKDFLYALVNLHLGPYDAVKVVETLQDFLVRNNEDLGDYYDLIRLKAEEANNQGCVLKYATDGTRQPIVLTSREFFALFPEKMVH